MRSPEAGPVTRPVTRRAVTCPAARNRKPLRGAGFRSLPRGCVTSVTARPETQAAPRFWPVTRPSGLRNRVTGQGGSPRPVTLVTLVTAVTRKHTLSPPLLLLQEVTCDGRG